MNKRKLHHYAKRLIVIRFWYFLIAALILGVICIVAMRQNYKHMTVLRQAVYTADQQNGDVNGALNNLRKYVYGHMNTGLAQKDGVYPPIQLKYTYDRLLQAATDQSAAANSQIYTDAQHYCEAQNSVDFSGHNRVPCIEEYVSNHGVKAVTIPDSLYKFDFASPKWSPDLAGWSMVLAILCVPIAAAQFIAQRWFKHHLA